MTHPSFTPFGGDEARQAGLAEADIVILPLCYENAVSYGTGTHLGPYHLLNASLQLEMLDEETFFNWGSMPIHTLAPLTPAADPESAVREMEAAAHSVIKVKKFLLSLGGDHAVSIGPIRAAKKVWPDLGVLQIDAHLDLRDEWNGSRWNHACVMRRVAADMGLPIVQVGVRSFSPEEADYIQQKGLRPFFAHDLSGDASHWIHRVIDALPQTVYLTIDLDGLDPSVIPGTGTPEPGGLTYRQLISLIRALGEKRQVVAADITELSKIEGTQVSEFTAAKIATKIFVHCWRQSKSAG